MGCIEYSEGSHDCLKPDVGREYFCIEPDFERDRCIEPILPYKYRLLEIEREMISYIREGDIERAKHKVKEFLKTCYDNPYLIGIIGREVSAKAVIAENILNGIKNKKISPEEGVEIYHKEFEKYMELEKRTRLSKTSSESEKVKRKLKKYMKYFDEANRRDLDKLLKGLRITSG